MTTPIVMLMAALAAGDAPERNPWAEPGDRPLVFGINRVGDPGVLFHPPDYDEHMYRRVREVGGTCVRIVGSPQDVEKVRGQRDWSRFDEDLRLALKYEQEPIVLIVNIPAWASPTGEATHDRPYKDELIPEFEDFCEELARRTRGKVRKFQLWNEQNGFGWHVEERDGRLIFNRTDEYYPMLKAYHAGIKRGNPEAIASLGALCDAMGNGHIFVRKLYEEMKQDGVTEPLYDAVSDHPYSDTPEVMRGKLDAIKEVLAKHGDDDLPFWITEYGWNTTHTSLEDQAARLGSILDAFISPEWSDVEASIYLSIADFEMRTTGFGLTDANLRPRPAFYVFQGASRFGAYPPYRIEPVFTAADTLTITWKTREATTGRIVLTDKASDGGRVTKETPAGKEHRVVFEGLKPDRDLQYVIETTREHQGRPKSIRSAVYDIRTPGRQFYNGDMEKGFFAGIAHGWKIEGRGFATDASLVPYVRVLGGRHAQSVHAEGGDKDHGGIDTTMSNIIATEPGETIRVALAWATRSTSPEATVRMRAGIDPKGGTDPANTDILWTSWQSPRSSWAHLELELEAEHSLARLIIECKSEGDLGPGLVACMIDQVRRLDP